MVTKPQETGQAELSQLGETGQESGNVSTSSANSSTGKFQAGDAWRGNRNGRPRKGESVPEKLRRKVEKHGDQVVEAVYQRLLRTDSVGNRAFADVRDTIYGVPKQTLVLESEQDPALDWLLAKAGKQAWIEGESRVI